MERLAAVETGPAATNFFNRAVPENALRRHNLEIYLQEMLDRRPKVLLVGEAPGFRGMRITGVPFTNRTPVPSETELGTPFRQELAGLFGISSIVAVGNVAHHSLHRSGLAVPKIRHPAHGGRSGFKRGLEQLLAAGMQA